MKFDTYTFQSRILPAIIFILPFIIVINLIVFSLNINISISASMVNVLFFVILIALSSAFRYYGKNLQCKLFDKWGGAPTTRFLRLTNNEYNYDSKKYLRTKVTKTFNGLKMPTLEEEKEDAEKTDKTYEAIVAQIREVTRDKSKFPIVYRENVNYGMMRNLFSLKRAALVLLFMLITISISLYCTGYLGVDFFVISIITCIVCVIIWILITEDKVKKAAEDYARALFDAFSARDENNRNETRNTK